MLHRCQTNGLQPFTGSIGFCGYLGLQPAVGPAHSLLRGKAMPDRPSGRTIKDGRGLAAEVCWLQSALVNVCFTCPPQASFILRWQPSVAGEDKASATQALQCAVFCKVGCTRACSTSNPPPSTLEPATVYGLLRATPPLCLTDSICITCRVQHCSVQHLLSGRKAGCNCAQLTRQGGRNLPAFGEPVSACPALG